MCVIVWSRLLSTMAIFPSWSLICFFIVLQRRQSDSFHLADKGQHHTALTPSPSHLSTLLSLPPPLCLNLSKVFIEVSQELPGLFALQFFTYSVEFPALSSNRHKLRGKNSLSPMISPVKTISYHSRVQQDEALPMKCPQLPEPHCGTLCHEGCNTDSC